MAGTNQNQAVRTYTKEFRELLPAVFRKRSYFASFFAGGLEVMDGITNKDVAFSIKTSDIPVVLKKYDKGANVAFGTGTANSSRFGAMTEVIYNDLDVPYADSWAFNEGIDRHTVNQDLDTAVADRLDLQAQARATMFNDAFSKFISGAAKKNIEKANVTVDNVVDLFNELDKYYTNLETVGTRVAVVNSDIYNMIVDNKLSTTAKGSDVNIDRNEVRLFKDFVIEKAPDAMFQGQEVIYTYIAGIGKAFIGIETTRAIEHPDFDGLALQGAGKYGHFVLEDNKPAIAKVTLQGA